MSIIDKLAEIEKNFKSSENVLDIGLAAVQAGISSPDELVKVIVGYHQARMEMFRMAERLDHARERIFGDGQIHTPKEGVES